MTAASTISDDPLPAGHESSSQQPKSAFLPFDVNQMGSDQRWGFVYCFALLCSAVVSACFALKYGRAWGVCVDRLCTHSGLPG